MEVIIHACYLQMELDPGALDTCHGSGFCRNIARRDERGCCDSPAEFPGSGRLSGPHRGWRLWLHHKGSSLFISEG